MLIGVDRDSFCIGALCGICLFIAAIIVISILPVSPSEDFCSHGLNGRGYAFPNEEKAASRCTCDIVTEHINQVTIKKPSGEVVDITNSSTRETSYYDNCHLMSPDLASVKEK